MGRSAQVKPRFVIAFDTSGSMVYDLAGNTTYGDGVGRPTQVGDDPALVRGGVYYGCGTTAGLDRDCNGFPDDSRIAIAKAAVRNMVAGFGAVEWALLRFTQTSTQHCNTYVGQSSCVATGTLTTSALLYGNPQCNSGAVDNVGCVGAIPDSCEPGKGGATGRTRSLKVWAAGPPADFNGCINYTGTCTGGDVLVGFPNMDPFVGLDNRSAILKWMDNVETAYLSSTTVGNFCNHKGGGDCELRPQGNTPLGGILDSALSYVDPIRSADDARACRPYSVILITDGVETCSQDPSARATALFDAGVYTYVVGVWITPASRPHSTRSPPRVTRPARTSQTAPPSSRLRSPPSSPTRSCSRPATGKMTTATATSMKTFRAANRAWTHSHPRCSVTRKPSAVTLRTRRYARAATTPTRSCKASRCPRRWCVAACWTVATIRAWTTTATA